MNKKMMLARSLVVMLCSCLALTVHAQGGGRGGGGGGGGGTGGGGGGGGRGGGGAGGFGGSAGQGTSASSGYVPNGQIGSITFTTDPVTGSIIYITDETNNINIVKALTALDAAPKPQVLIKVVFLEVTYNNGLDFGLEASFSHTFNPNLVGGATNGYGLIGEGINNTTTGAISSPGAAFATIAAKDFTADLRAIAEKGTVKILSRPTILARHGQPAQIVIGQEVPLITGVNFGTLGQVTSVITYTSVGIILNVTPFISPNGDVEMILAPQISEVAAQSTLISASTNGNFSTPYINTRSANTVVITPDGQTVVIGGLMQDSKSVTDDKIPVLGDIPLLGNLFKHKVKADAKTELIIYVTPYVVRTPEDLARMSSDEHSRPSMTQKAFSKKELQEYIDPTSPNQGGGPSPEMAVPANRTR
jgi:general secretion pathway protein D